MADSNNLVTLICSEDEKLDDSDQLTISTAEISTWELPSVFSKKLLRIVVNPNRLIEESSYFRGLLGGSFSESCLDYVSIKWNVESFVSVLRIVYGCEVEISSNNFVHLNEAALFFGVDKLLVKCGVWLAEVTSNSGRQSPQLLLEDLICIWKYGFEHGKAFHSVHKMEVEYVAANDFILQLCTSYLARNFMWALSFNCYTDVPYKLLYSCIQHPDFTVDSERHLSDGILVWLIANTNGSEDWSSNDLCHQIRISLLPLWFAAGKRRCHFLAKFADKATGAILGLQRHHSTALTKIFREDDLDQIRVRLTTYTQKVDISGCPQITAGLFLLSMLPSSNEDPTLKMMIKRSFINHVKSGGDGLKSLLELGQVMTFEGVQELDISNCPSFSLESAIEVLWKPFPLLRSLKAAYSLNFNSKKLCQLVQKFPLLTTIDLTLDVEPVVPAQVSVIASSSVLTPEKPTASHDIYNRHSAASLYIISQPLLSNIRKLTLEGRTEINDSELLRISEVCHSLSYVNMKGCTLVTDYGISVMILKCKELDSILACDTSFGSHSALALCSGNSSETQESEKHSQLMAHKLLTLHISRCRGIAENIVSLLLSKSDNLRSLCLRETRLLDDALYKFSGASLEMLDVSDTKVSRATLFRVISRNPNLKSLRTRGCKTILQQESETKVRTMCMPTHTLEEFFMELGKCCKVEELELGWGFSYFSLRALKPAINTLRTLVVGLGGSLGPDGLELLPPFCPMLETLILYFQVISDSAIINILKNLQHLQCLALSYCFGGISSLSFKTRIIPNLRNLKLERVTPWMTNEELAILAENCADLVKFSLVGCPLLDFEAQAIISNGWPGLTSLHLEECGEMTADGVTSLLDCHALEDLTIRHTGTGISRDFIIFAASRLPMLRKISVDICDAKEGDFDLPSFDDRYYLSSVKIARCKLQKSALEVQDVQGCRTPVHKETLLLFWNSQKLVTRVVKERL